MLWASAGVLFRTASNNILSVVKLVPRSLRVNGLNYLKTRNNKEASNQAMHLTIAWQVQVSRLG